MRPASTVRVSARSRDRRSAAPAAAASCGSTSHSSCQLAASRSCAGIAAWLSGPVRPAAWRARARIAWARVGLAFCGMVDEPPPGSASSAISVWASRMTSWAILPREPATRASQPPNSMTASRWACQGVGATARSRISAIAASTAGPSGPRADRVPAAPPKDSTASRGSISSRRSRWRISGARQPAALRPKVVGVACWPQVRPAMTVLRWASARARNRSARPVRRSARMRPTWRSCSTKAVSTMSWVVAPQWT